MDDAAIMGLDALCTNPCGRRIRDSQRYCGCGVMRISPYSRVSKILVWRCQWCKCRHGKVGADEAKRLKAFVAMFGWNMRPLLLHADPGYVRVAY